MRSTIVCSCLAISVGLAGCGSRPAVAPGENPLSMEEWNALPVELKYEIETLERLKQGNPKLQNQREWDKFTRAVLIPSKKKDQPKEERPVSSTRSTGKPW